MTISMTSSLLKHCAYAESISVSLLKKTVIDVNWNCNFFGCFLSTFVLSLRRSSQIRPSFCLCQLPACILSVFYSLDSCSLRASLCFWTCSSAVSSVWADWRVTVPAAEGQQENSELSFAANTEGGVLTRFIFDHPSSLSRSGCGFRYRLFAAGHPPHKHIPGMLPLAKSSTTNVYSIKYTWVYV